MEDDRTIVRGWDSCNLYTNQHKTHESGVKKVTPHSDVICVHGVNRVPIQPVKHGQGVINDPYPATKLVGGLNPSEKYELVNWDDDIPNIWKNKIHVPNHQPVILDQPIFCFEIYFNLDSPDKKKTESYLADSI